MTDADEFEIARSGDDMSFGNLAERYRNELRVHCYRMLGSYVEAEDHVQETMLRAWRARSDFEGRSSVRAWLYRIATNVCLDTLRRKPERVLLVGAGLDAPPSEIPWLQPIPDAVLDRVGPREDEPEVLAVARETIELAYLAAIQLLPPNQRAVLILRDVLDWSAAETAELLETSVASVTSALQRARATLKEHRRSAPDELTAVRTPSAEERELLRRYMDAHLRADSAAVVALMRADVRFTMPPYSLHYEGIDAVGGFFAEALGPDRQGDFRLVPTSANRLPAAANYLRPRGESEFRALSIDVLRFVDGRLAEITTFEPWLFPYFGLPEVFADPTD